MNQRIRELAKESDLDWHKHWNDDESNRLEKFAELIVRECVNIVDDAERGGSNEIWDNAVKFIGRDLKEYFGVEE